MKKVISIILAVVLLVGGGLFLKNYVSDAINNAYENGYNLGKTDGEKDGYSRGYDAGENAGYDSGYDAGKQAAQSSSSSSSGGNSSSGGSSYTDYSTGTTYIGNANTGVFHYSYCSYLPEPQNRVTIYSRSSAILQGYTPCGHCNP